MAAHEEYEITVHAPSRDGACLVLGCPNRGEYALFVTNDRGRLVVGGDPVCGEHLKTAMGNIIEYGTSVDHPFQARAKVGKLEVETTVATTVQTFPVPFTTQELLEEYYQILELSRAVFSAVGRIRGGELDRLMTRLEAAYARETVHGGLVHAGRTTGKAGAPAEIRKDSRPGQEVDHRQRTGGRSEEGELPAAGDVRVEEPGTEVPKLETIIKLANQASAMDPHDAALNMDAYDLIEALARHVQRVDQHRQNLARGVRESIG